MDWEGKGSLLEIFYTWKYKFITDIEWNTEWSLKSEKKSDWSNLEEILLLSLPCYLFLCLSDRISSLHSQTDLSISKKMAAFSTLFLQLMSWAQKISLQKSVWQSSNHRLYAAFLFY